MRRGGVTIVKPLNPLADALPIRAESRLLARR
jgi:hypothetical protein